MKTIFDAAARQEILDRFNKLSPQTQSVWGKMNVAQMVAHCALTYQVPVGDLVLRPTWVRFIGKFFRKLAFNDTPFRKNSPTAGEFLVTDERIFETEKQNFMRSFNKLTAGESVVVCKTHGFFGPLTPAEWGKLMYKHTDHHFQQFGV